LDRKRDSEATRTAIMDAAEALFLENGFGRTAMSAVAKHAGVTKSLIHHHFGSKRELWDAVKGRMMQAYFEAQKNMLEQESGDIELLERSIKAYFYTLRDNPDFIRMLTWIFLEKDTDCYDLGKQITQLGIEKLKEGQSRGQIRSDIHPSHILFTFLALCEHWFLSKDTHLSNPICRITADHHSENEDDAFLEDLMKIFFKGIMP